MDDLTGKQLRPYQIVAPLGEGGMAAVYRAFQPSVNRYVAVKVLPQYFARDPQFAARFEREAHLLAQLQHPNILPVFDYGTAEVEGGKYTYIAMPLIKGGSLESLMHRQRLDFKAIRKVITQVGDALDYAHSLNLIHRDVKPANILIDERGNCLLTDFGLARMVEGTAKLTSSGTIMGTPAYMSPEQGKGQPLDRRTDIYSLGIILYELAVGRPPFEADTPMVVVVKHINDPLPLPSTVVANFPPMLEKVIIQALAKDRDDRYPTAAAFVEAVTQALDAIDRPGPQTAPVKAPPTQQAAPSVMAASARVGTTPPAPANPSLIRRAWWVLPVGGLAGLLALALLGGASIFLINQFLKRTPTPVALTAPASTEPAAVTLTEPPSATEAVATEAGPEPTALADTELLNEDFENGEAQGWQQITGNDTSEIVTLSDGNHVAHVIAGDSGGGLSIYSPSFDFAGSDYSVEVDVMVVDPTPGNTTLRLNARIPQGEPQQSCLGYAAVLGAGWASLDKIQVPDNDCESGDWQENSLAPVSDFELKSEEWHHLRLDVQGNNLQYYVDGTLIASATDFVDAWRSGGIGISAYQFKEIYLDNFQIHAHPEPLADLDQSNWTVSFTRYFSPDTWSEGDHTYTFNLACPGLENLNSTITQRFSVDSQAEPPPDPSSQLYLTEEGLRYIFIGGDSVEGAFNPAFQTLAVYNVGGLTQTQAGQAVIRCDATMDWDDNNSDVLTPVMVYQH